jgi:preprotein translocase subunit Sec63
MGGWKIAKEPNEKNRFSITYHKTKVQKLGNPTNKKVEKMYVTI